jgi:hypothetical protein
MDSRIARFRVAQMSAFAEILFAVRIPAILSPAQARDFFTLERDEFALSRFWDSRIERFLIQRVGWEEAGAG